MISLGETTQNPVGVAQGTDKTHGVRMVVVVGGQRRRYRGLVPQIVPDKVPNIFHFIV